MHFLNKQELHTIPVRKIEESDKLLYNPRALEPQGIVLTPTQHDLLELNSIYNL